MKNLRDRLFFVFFSFCFLLLSNNTLHVMSYTYICYWNRFQYKYIIQITFHVVKQSHARITSKVTLFTLYHISLPISVLSRLRFISWSSRPPLSFNWPREQLYLKAPNFIYVLNWCIIHCLIYFGFIECLCMHLFWQLLGENSRVTQNWVTNSSYAWLSFLKKIHENVFCFRFFARKFFFFRLFIFSCYEIVFLKTVLTCDNSF